MHLITYAMARTTDALDRLGRSPPENDMKRLDQPLFEQLAAKARMLPRQRTHHCLHQDTAEPVQRMCMALAQDTYVRPHRHSVPPRWELLVVLSGRVLLVTFDAFGQLEQRLSLEAGGALSGIELEPGCWHSVVVADPAGAILLEVKPGPYQPLTPEEVAPWAPAEGEPQAQAFIGWCRQAQVGERFVETKSGA